MLWQRHFLFRNIPGIHRSALKSTEKGERGGKRSWERGEKRGGMCTPQKVVTRQGEAPGVHLPACSEQETLSSKNPWNY